ncbi:MAG: Transcription regulator [contains diacylglycerol kinase catalytic domain] [uncultured Rubrobacteraceae bacterium]|uniref:Transcription regulator [contains diacylglycerol kinase catalytic domain] n=1 Tax=uncultured Rubrobacteraceae bacterium TaxID=349277 RepID=A0A6J4PKD3_9ACTN|nr:MAG: Transcription regulator [contains diacylglycerol kinase catalytic domain] [uncultured Rubrobacteraceae bacterium]
MMRNMEAREAVIIGNPKAGRNRGKDRLKRCAEILRSGGLDVEVWPTERPQHATELADLAGTRLVVAAGGDGTVNEVVNGLKTDATLGILPLGTANVLARELGLPLNPEAACERILAGKERRIDVGVAKDRKGRERRFTCMAGMGFDAHVVNEVTPRLKRYLKILAFPLAAVKVYLEGDLPPLHIFRGDDKYVTQFAIVANGQYYGGDFRVSEEAALATGKLEVVLIDRVGRLLRADILTRILARRPLNRSMRSFTARELRATSPGAQVPVQLDGEVWGRLPMSFRIEPGILKVVH